MKSDDSVRKLVKLFLRKHEKSQAQICRELGIHSPQVSNYVNKSNKGRVLADIHIVRLCNYLGLDVKVKLSVKEEENE